MSIGIYAFLRIYFLSFGLSAFAQFRTHCPPSSAAAVPIAQRVQRPGACRALRGLPWYLPRPGSGTACATACAVQSFRVRWGLGSPPAGHTAAAQPRPVSLSTTEKIKKAQKNYHTPYCQSQKFRRKNKKTPTKGLRSVLYLPYKP